MHKSLVITFEKTYHISIPKFSSANEVVKNIAVDSKNRLKLSLVNFKQCGK